MGHFHKEGYCGHQGQKVFYKYFVQSSKLVILRLVGRRD
jgi:hypothetical protein